MEDRGSKSTSTTLEVAELIAGCENPLHWLGIVYGLPIGYLYMAKQRLPKPETAETRPAKSRPATNPTRSTGQFGMSWHHGFTSARGIVREIQKSNPPLYRKIAAVTSANHPHLDQIITVLLEEVKSKSAARRRYAFRLMCSSMNAIEGDDYELEGALPKQRKLVFNLLCRSLRNDDWQVRVWAVRALAYYIAEDLGEQRRIVRILIKDGIANEDPATAISAIDTLRKYVDRDVASGAVPALVSALVHTDDEVRKLACEALRYFYKDSLEVVPALASVVLTDTSDVVGLAAMQALMKIVSVEELVQTLFDAADDLDNLLSRLRIGGKPLRVVRQRLKGRQLELAEIAPDRHRLTERASSTELSKTQSTTRARGESGDAPGGSGSIAVADEAPVGDATQTKIGPSKRRGGQQKYDSDRDRKIAETARINGAKEAARLLGIPTSEVRQAKDRHRKRPKGKAYG
jgi:HEAT repeats